MPDPHEPWRASIARLRAMLEAAFDRLSAELLAANDHLDARPDPTSWSAREIGEHVLLCDRYLLLLVEKIRDKSARRLARGAPWPAREPRLDPLEKLAERGFPWTHPAHMTPGGALPLEELLAGLAADRERALALLEALPPGAGTLHTIRMSVVGPEERLDLYQYLAVVALHADRHARQVGRGRSPQP